MAEPFLKAGVELAALYDQTMSMLPGEEEIVAGIVADFLDGKAVHTMPKNGILLVDQLFKKIRAFKQAEQVRNKECQLRYTNDNQTS